MYHSWTLEIEKLGRIDEARIELSPFMAFVGDNNTGKSYVISLIWWLLSMGHTLFPEKSPSSDAYRRCEFWLESQIGDGEFFVDESAQQLFVDWFNELLAQRKKDVLQNLFNHPIDAHALRISAIRCDPAITVTLKEEGNRFRVRWSRGGSIEGPSPYADVSSDSGTYWLVRLITSALISGTGAAATHHASTHPGIARLLSAAYLPAARTGFMLTYKMLAQAVMAREFESSLDQNDEHARVRFSLPTARFLTSFLALETSGQTRRTFDDIADFLESNVLHGGISQDNSPIPSYLFTPDGASTGLPMHVSSSLVTELTPLVLFLRYGRLNNNSLLIEEPEAYLHPAAQRVVARALIRLANRGVYVGMTTHSDTMVQQFNNLVKLYHHPDRTRLQEKLGYEDSDLISASFVRAYQFTPIGDGRTRVEGLPCTQEGIAFPTFNHTILELSQEVLALQEDYDAE